MTDNLAIWNAVSKTNPAHTKHVNQRGGFTAINANAQIMEATRQFGPIGVGWGYIAGTPIFHDTLVIVPVTLWHGDRANTFGPVFGSEEWKDNKGRVDSDAPKKAGTDGLTKLLSQLGFNADVFLGLYDDQKYVAQMKAEFEEKPEPPAVIDDAQYAEIIALAQAAGVPVKRICEAAKVDTLQQLPATEYEPVRKKLNLTIDQNTQKKEAA
jgi:hypothetical protein